MVETVTVIEARPKTFPAQLAALWRFRRLYRLLVKELTIRKVRGTLLGAWWLILRPLFPSVIAVVTFTFVVKIDTYGIPYVIFFFSGFTTWQIFQATMGFLPRTLLWMRGMMRRVYFPKLLVPMAAVGPPLIELGLTMLLFLVAVVFIYATTGSTHLNFGWEMLWFPICLIFAMLFALSIGMVLSVVALFFRDIIFITGYATQLLLFLTPILYPVRFIPEDFRWIIYVFNPLAQLVEVSRWSLVGYGDFSPFFFALAIGFVLVIFSLSVVFFLRAETYLADEL